MSDDERRLDLFTLRRQGFEQGQEVSAELWPDSPNLAAEPRQLIDAYRAMNRLAQAAARHPRVERTISVRRPDDRESAGAVRSSSGVLSFGGVPAGEPRGVPGQAVARNARRRLAVVSQGVSESALLRRTC